VVVGVMEPSFEYPFADAWVPLPPLTDPNGVRRWHRHNMVGRLASGVGVAEANELLVPFAARLEADHPVTNDGNFFEAVALLDDTVGSVRPALVVLVAGVAALLLITCVNLTSLTLARATTRTSELALRRALGGSVSRLARMLVLESVVVSLAGGARRSAWRPRAAVRRTSSRGWRTWPSTRSSSLSPRRSRCSPESSSASCR
jgi:hypothetical protein